MLVVLVDWFEVEVVVCEFDVGVIVEGGDVVDVVDYVSVSLVVWSGLVFCRK